MQKKLLTITLLLHCCIHAQTPLFDNITRANRRYNSAATRSTATIQRRGQALAPQTTSGDEALYSDYRGSFGKSLAQLDSCFINPTAFEQLVSAIDNNDQALFNAIAMGTSPVERKLVDPQAAFAFSLDGADGWIHTMPAAPTLASAETAGEMVECYGHALLRDVAFNDYDTDATAGTVIGYLNALSNFKGPKVGGVVTDGTLFRGPTPGDLVGPYISQFLYLPIPYGPAPNYDGSGTLAAATQAQVVPEPFTTNTNDFMTTITGWKAVQTGANPENSIIFDTTTRTFIRNGRDLGDYVHQDTPPGPYLNAASILIGFGSNALDPNNPYLNNSTQEAFPTFNIPDILYLISSAAELALKAAWYQKWVVHRRVRPEFVGWLIHQQVTGAIPNFMHSDVLTSGILGDINIMYGTRLLPQAYPEGSPTHPSYPAGHATVAGACATILKAFFNENFVVPNPLEPNAANTALVPNGDTLTVGGEINKLASNICLGRDHAGVHYRSDGVEGMILGEKVALALLEDEGFTRNIPFDGFTVTKFDGTQVTIGQRQAAPQLR